MLNPSLLYDSIRQSFHGTETLHIQNLDDERMHAVDFLIRRCPGEERELVERFFSYFTREVFQKGDIIWRQGDKSDSAKVLVSGDLICFVFVVMPDVPDWQSDFRFQFDYQLKLPFRCGLVCGFA